MFRHKFIKIFSGLSRSYPNQIRHSFTLTKPHFRGNRWKKSRPKSATRNIHKNSQPGIDIKDLQAMFAQLSNFKSFDVEVVTTKFHLKIDNS